METLRNPGINFPVSGLTAIIVTGMLLIFNFNLSNIYIPIKIIDRPQPVQVDYSKPPEPIETVAADDPIQEPIAPTKRETTPATINPQETTAPIPRGDIAGPGEIVITNVKPDIDVRIPHVRGHFTPKQVDKRPRVLRPVNPIYPHQATVNGIEGRVVLRFIVDENGKVLDPVVVKAEPEGVFEEAALAAIVKYKFIPATIGKKNVKCIAVLPIGFEIK